MLGENYTKTRTWSGEGRMRSLAVDHYNEKSALISIHTYQKLEVYNTVEIHDEVDGTTYSGSGQAPVNYGRLVYWIPGGTAIKETLGQIDAGSCQILYPFMVYTYRMTTNSPIDSDVTDRKVGIIHMESGKHTIYDAADLGITDTTVFMDGFLEKIIERWKCLTGIGLLNSPEGEDNGLE